MRVFKFTSPVNRRVAVGAAAALVATFLAAPSGAWADTSLTDDNVSASDVQAALSLTDAQTGLVADPASSTQTATDAAVAKSASGVTVEVPRDPEVGVTLTSSGGTDLTIGLPGAEDAANAKRLSDGTVAYAGTDGSATAVVPAVNGVQFLTTIANADAPTRYTYKLSASDGQHFVVNKDGSAFLIDAEGNIVAAIAPAWAKDTNGKAIPTRYEVDGMGLTQVVEHTSVEDIAYPVVADPWWIPIMWFVVRCATGLGLSSAMISRLWSLPSVGSVAGFSYALWACIRGY